MLGQNSSTTRPLIRQDEEQDYKSLHCLTANSLTIIADLQKQGRTHGMIQLNKQTALLLPSSSAASFPTSESIRPPGQSQRQTSSTRLLASETARIRLWPYAACQIQPYLCWQRVRPTLAHCFKTAKQHRVRGAAAPLHTAAPQGITPHLVLTQPRQIFLQHHNPKLISS